MTIDDLKKSWNEAWGRLKAAIEEPFVVETVVASGRFETFVVADKGSPRLNWDAVLEAVTLKADEEGSKVKIAIATRRDLVDGDSITFISEDKDLVPVLPDLVKVHNEAQKAALELRQQNLDWIGRWINLAKLAL